MSDETIVWPPEDDIEVLGTRLTFDPSREFPMVIKGEKQPDMIIARGIFSAYLMEAMEAKRIIRCDTDGEENMYRIKGCAVNMETGYYEFVLDPVR